jgi:hypothetical protein
MKISCINRKIIWVCPESEQNYQNALCFPSIFRQRRALPRWKPMGGCSNPSRFAGSARSLRQRNSPATSDEDPKTWGVSEILAGDLPSGYVKIAMWIYPLIAWWFSIAMLNYQRVHITSKEINQEGRESSDIMARGKSKIIKAAQKIWST